MRPSPSRPWPGAPPSAARPGVSDAPLDRRATASASSSSPSNAPSNDAAADSASPSSVTNRRFIPVRPRCTPIDAATDTACSNEPPGPSPQCARRRVSRNSVPLLWKCCSSRRTISSPCRAVDRQCTRRRSSPCRYSRGATSSSPAADTERARLSPPPPHAPLSRVAGSGTIAGVTVRVSAMLNERTSSTIPNGSASRTVSGPTRKRPRTSDRIR
ncbi:hypothetical protein amrb99_97390 [Actinomadura sp. RB99]|nr:hypothetical protein [Actinomadura sp. RB99]